MNPQTLLEPSWFPEYEASIDALWRQLLRLNANNMVLDKLLDFPLSLLAPKEQLFWDLIKEALFESSVLIIWRVAVDDDRRVLTLGKLMKLIATQIKPEFRDALSSIENLRAHDNAIDDFRGKIEYIRHNYVAHINHERHVRPTAEELKEDSVVLDELKGYASKICDYFDFLSFGLRRDLYLWGNSSDLRDPLNVAGILSKIAHDSPILNAPETNPDFWADIRQSLSQEEVDTLNDYRRRFSLPES